MRVLASLQRTIEALHDVSSNLDVTAYVVDDVQRRDMPGAVEGLPEQLFVRSCDGAVEMALYVAPSIVAQLEKDPPEACLHAGNLESFCIALEGVSHFVLVAWRAQHNLSVSALELEIQAEVDKFVSAWLMLTQQHPDGPQTARECALLLYGQLFNHYALRDALPTDEWDRYVTASRVAAGFCRLLTRKHGKHFSQGGIINDARTFFRQSLADKIRVG